MLAVAWTDPDSFQRRMEFAKLVRQYRVGKSLTQEQVADLSGLDRKTISRIENGHYNPSLDTLWALADALNIEAYSLLVPTQPKRRGY